MGGTFVRMAVAVGCVAVLQGRAADYGTTAEALGQWTTGFYLLTLVLESAVLCRRLGRQLTGASNEPPAR